MKLDQIYEIERSYHDNLAKGFRAQSITLDSLHGSGSDGLTTLAPWLQVREVMGEIKGKRVLDIGCGFGSHAILLAKEGANVTGIDLSPESIACASRNAQEESVEIEFKVSSAEDLSFHRFYDIVLCRASLHHFWDVPSVVKIAYESLKPGGFIVAQEPLRDNPIAKIGRKTANKPTPTEHPFVIGELDSIFDSIFGSHESRYFCVLSPMSLVFSKMGLYTLSSISFKSLNCIDKLLLPYLKRWAWIQVIWATKMIE